MSGVVGCKRMDDCKSNITMLYCERGDRREDRSETGSSAFIARPAWHAPDSPREAVKLSSRLIHRYDQALSSCGIALWIRRTHGPDDLLVNLIAGDRT